MTASAGATARQTNDDRIMKPSWRTAASDLVISISRISVAE